MFPQCFRGVSWPAHALGGRDGLAVGVAAHTVTVISKTDHRLLSSHTITPDRSYWRNEQKNPGR